MKVFCINIYDEYWLHSQARRALKCVYDHVIHKCKNITLQDYSRILVTLTILSTFSVRLPFRHVFKKEVIIFVVSYIYMSLCISLSLYVFIYHKLFTLVIQYRIQEISTKRQKPIHISTGCMSMLKTQLMN